MHCCVRLYDDVQGEARLAPVYDLVTTAVYLPKDSLALTLNGSTSRLRIILEEQNLPRIRFYDLRHTHASLLIAEGVHAKKIAERLGHASIKLTMDTYGHLFDGSDKESAERMDRLFAAKDPDPAIEQVDRIHRVRPRKLRSNADTTVSVGIQKSVSA